MTRSTLNVSKRTWHGRLWHWWRDNSEFKNGKADSYRENLCHYVRVILFWAPLALFLRYPLSKQREYITPASALVTLATVGWIGYVLIRYPVDTLTAIAIILGSVLFAIMAILSCLYIHDHQDAINEWWNTDGYGTHPIKAVGRFLARRILKVPVAGWLAGLALVLLTILVDWHIGLFFVLTVAAVALLLGFAALMAFITEKVKDRQAERRNLPKPDEGAIKVAGRFVQAKKHRICPFINVEDA